MSCIHFKFSNAVEDDRIKFDGLHISVADLKEAIVKQKSLKSNLFSLKIVDSQTKKGERYLLVNAILYYLCYHCVYRVFR